MEVMFAGQLPQSGWGRQRLSAPCLGDVAVDRTLWTIHGPKGSELVDALSARRISPWRQELHRLQSIASLTGLVESHASNEPLADLAAWYQPWARRFRHARDAAQREALLAREGESASGILAEVRMLDQEQARFSREVLGSPVAAQPVSAEVVADQPRQFWQLARPAFQPPLRAMFSGRSVELEVRRGEDSSGWLPRLAAAAGIALLTAAVLVLARRGEWSAWQRWRYVAGVALGVAWWLWLVPSVLGLVIVLLVVAAAFRDRAPRPREPGSAIVRLGTGN
jgi:hypothetical protein